MPEMNEGERPNEFWRKVYLTVIVTTVLVIMLLWSFSRYFAT